jgi:hypothetical protein
MIADKPFCCLQGFFGVSLMSNLTIIPGCSCAFYPRCAEGADLFRNWSTATADRRKSLVRDEGRLI